jgi:hypothetical protein
MRTVAHKNHIAIVAGAILVAAAIYCASSAHAQAVVPPQSESFPQTYGEWSAQWWQYVIGIPADKNPINDSTGARCQLGQWGTVFFLVGTASNDPVTRSCDVPAGAGLFFPLVNIICAVPEDGLKPEKMSDVCSGFIDTVDPKSLLLTIDGKKVNNLGNFRVSQFFSFTGATHGLFEFTGCEVALQPCYADFHPTAFSDGYWAMLRPLSRGPHTVRFKGTISAFDYTPDATYHLNVVPQ